MLIAGLFAKTALVFVLLYRPGFLELVTLTIARLVLGA